MKPREIFQQIRHQKATGGSLRLRLTLLVSGEVIVSILLALGLYFLLQDVIPMENAWLLLLDLSIVSMAVGSVVTLIVSKYFFAPIKKLGEAMERVADGDFDVRLEGKSSSKEIMEVYSGFNMMANELSATEILQTDFVSNVSHEFKTPINAIEGYATLLQDSENLSPAQHAYVDKIVYNTHRLSILVGSILLLSKLENQQIPTGQTSYRLDEQIRHSIVALEPAWEKKDVEFDVELARAVYVGNEPMMRHVWDNLISNAIKFSPQGGTVRMVLENREEGLVFAISDDGPGISEEAQKHIFDKFYQADSSHKQEGNGLGLALVKRILSMENGKIQVTNEKNGGACFTVTLKRKKE